MSERSRALPMAQYGTKHGHAAGCAQAMLANPDVELIGVYEPDDARRQVLQSSSAPPWSGVHWLREKAELIEDSSVVAVASEGLNAESLDRTEESVAAGKHVLYDKPAGDDYPRFERIVKVARERRLYIQMGYMWRYHDGFSRIAEWARSGLLGHVFAIRTHMSTNSYEEEAAVIARHQGGILYDLAGHMIDQIVWILGRRLKVTSFLRHDAFATPGFKDNTLTVSEFDRHGLGRHRGDGAQAYGTPLRGLWDGRIGDHGALRAGRYHPALPPGSGGRLPGRCLDHPDQPSATPRRTISCVSEGHTGRRAAGPLV